MHHAWSGGLCMHAYRLFAFRCLISGAPCGSVTHAAPCLSMLKETGVPTGHPSAERVDSVPSLTMETMVRAVSAGGGFCAAALWPFEEEAKHRNRVVAGRWAAERPPRTPRLMPCVRILEYYCYGG